jgi:hypothetical protein
MAHLGVFDADAPIFCHAFDQASFSRFINLHVLFFHLMSDSQ